MRIAGRTYALLLGFMFGCTDHATIGGLCREPCALVEPGHDANTPDAGTADAGPDCREGSYALTRMQLDLLLVIDDTASVAPWLPALYDGLDLFLHEKASNGIGVGLQRFDEVCEPEAYTELLVPIGALPENAQALQDALELMLTASTSTTPALDGAHRSARTWANAHADGRMAVVLLTDASPGACDGLVGDWDAEAQRIARNGYERMPSIKTYVVGFGTMETVSTIARAGGTEPVLISTTPPETEVQAALDSMRTDAQPCAFKWPAEWTLAPDSTVVATAPNGMRRHYPIGHDASACDKQDAFYVEDPTSTFPLIACPDSCAGIAGDTLTLSSACVGP